MNKTNSDYTYSFESSKSAEDIFKILLDVRKWWSGFYEEKIEGSSNQLNDEFTFNAGGGAHYSRQKLIELIPAKKIIWLVTDSRLTFLKNVHEWNGSKIIFDVSKQDDKIKVQFTHTGLTSALECYDSCSNAWNMYLQKLADNKKV